MFKRILFAFDFSNNSRLAREIAFTLSKGEGKKLHVLTVANPLLGVLPGVTTPETKKPQGENYIAVLTEKELEEELIKRLEIEMQAPSEVGISPSLKVRFGDPAEEILKEAKEIDAELILMGSHSSRTLLDVVMGSVTEEVAKNATCPVLIVSQPPAQKKGGRQRILLGTDFSLNSKVAFKVALSLAKDSGANLYLLTVIPALIGGQTDLWTNSKEEAEKGMARLVQEARERGVQTGILIKRGNPVKEISRAAQDLEVDFVVLGSHSRRNIWDVLLGNTPEKVSRISPSPVLIVTTPTKKPEICEDKED